MVWYKIDFEGIKNGNSSLKHFECSALSGPKHTRKNKTELTNRIVGKVKTELSHLSF
jgi:hypothetical protein